jgi:hypothetical protein
MGLPGKHGQPKLKRRYVISVFEYDYEYFYDYDYEYDEE